MAVIATINNQTTHHILLNNLNSKIILLVKVISQVSILLGFIYFVIFITSFIIAGCYLTNFELIKKANLREILRQKQAREYMGIKNMIQAMSAIFVMMLFKILLHIFR